MTYDIISMPSRFEMCRAVERALNKGATCQGSPWLDRATGMWSQAVILPEESDTVKLREPAKKK